MKTAITKEQLQNWIKEGFEDVKSLKEPSNLFLPLSDTVKVGIDAICINDIPCEDLPVWLNSNDEGVGMSVYERGKHGELVAVYCMEFVKNVDIEDGFSYLADIMLNKINTIEETK